MHYPELVCSRFVMAWNVVDRVDRKKEKIGEIVDRNIVR